MTCKKHLPKKPLFTKFPRLLFPRFQRKKSFRQRALASFSLGAKFHRLAQAKSGQKINVFLTTNKLTGRTRSPMGSGRGAEGPLPVVVSNALITANNF
jgi:hypothetical protein